MLKVVLAGTLSHYETRGMIDEKRLEHMLAAGKQILYKTHQESEVRYVPPRECPALRYPC
jgi:palmitoyltransferase